MFGIGFGKKAHIKEEIGEIESWIIGHSLQFTAETTRGFPAVPQMLLATEALAFFLHALRRLAYRPNEAKVWMSSFEPSVRQIVQLFAVTLNGWSGADLDPEQLAKDVQNLVSTRNLEYQTLPFLTGNLDDRQTVVCSAARRISEAVDAGERPALIAAIHRNLTRVTEAELALQAEKLELALYGNASRPAFGSARPVFGMAVR